ncbi:phage holin family protein [Vagococcus elongatus]|uniref:Holin n=1 Tax=Vagococcus elongatus TaxID=180344 RepID=A0A430AU33_9ENTE|nr:phage holin family protein [Vagococcus elongatus]RSU11560.1 hypothetical protein CBF29_07720 [Vagococcus elongatus]
MEFENYIILMSFLGSLVVGFVIKHTAIFHKLANDFIPLIVAVVGSVVACLTQGVNVESIIFGAISGLASTGAHQAFTRFINRNNEEEQL